MIVELERPLGRIFSDLCGVGREGESVLLIARFSGVDLLGLFWSPRGVAVGFDGVRVVLDSFVGVDGADPERVGVPGAEPLVDRLIEFVLDVKDRSRKPYSFLYARGGQGGLPSNGGSLRARLSLVFKKSLSMRSIQ